MSLKVIVTGNGVKKTTLCLCRTMSLKVGFGGNMELTFKII